MAQKKAGGSTRNGRDSHSKRLGVKCFGGEFVNSGNIIVRQNGTKFHAGDNVLTGRDYTLYSNISGYVFFKKKGILKKNTVSVYSDKNIIL